MPPLELLPATRTAASQAKPDAAGKNPEKSSGDEFGRLMEHALTPKDQPGATESSTNKAKSSPAEGRPHLVKPRGQATAEAAQAKNPEPESSSPADHAGTMPAGIMVASEAGKSKVEEKIPADGLPALMTDLTGVADEPPPIFLTLPPTPHFVTDTTGVSVPTSQGTDKVQGVGMGTGQTIASGPSPIQNGNTPIDLKAAPAATETLPQTTGQFSAPLAPPLNGRETLPPAEGGKAPATTVKTASTVLENLKSELSVPNPTVTVPTDAKAPAEPDTSALTTGSLTKSGLEGGALPADAAILKRPMETAGTGVATTASSMKKEQNENKVAGLDVKVLPGGTNDSVRERVLQTREAALPSRAVESRNPDYILPWTPASAVAGSVADTQNLVALPSLTDAQLKNVERTHDLVAMHALRFVESKSDSMLVVIKPGAGTELSLELKHRNGGVEIEAVLQRGDYQWLNQHWPDLQQRLEQRGIKLAALGGENNFTPDGNQNFSRQQSQREAAAQQASAFAEFTVAMNRGGATARLAPATAGGWESWA